MGISGLICGVCLCTCESIGPGGEEDGEAGVGLYEGDGQTEQSEAKQTD